MRAATFFDGEEWRDGVVEIVDGRMRVRDAVPDDSLPRLDGLITAGFTDHHVHLQLVDVAPLARSVLGRVVDLGANPTVVARLAARHNSGHAVDAGEPIRAAAVATPGPSAVGPEVVLQVADDGPTIEYAGAFLTAPGGYPSDREWAPDGSVREVIDAAQAAAAVDEMADAGAHTIKVASNTVAGPVFGDALIRAIVDLAAARGLPVVAHAEGPGEAQRLAGLGVASLAHAPFTERLDDAEVVRQAASVAWISTLAIHDRPTRDVVIDNVRRFHAAGGTVRYGTDMGNGPTPAGLNPAEIGALREAGVTGAALLRALAPGDARASDARLLLLPGTAPADADPLAARLLSPDDLKV
ncbi:amidohydrolase family protein [uncultured Microbacterium sp.]|uniref:amidohydrolase family protein n=1 Tax=uncultured Microbacterium sp. TaxID=191216 RepID=UPI0028DC70C1|nr:amidohydrolase family protein [uncultured Microbacterium sp.]